MALPIQVNPKDPCIDIHTGRGQGSCTFANGFNCVCSCAGIAHAQLLRMVLTPENSKKLPDKYKQALANKVQTVQARIADIPHDKVTTIIHAQKQPKRVFFLCEDVSHPIIDYCRVIDILRWARENPLASQQVSKLCTCVQNHGINYTKFVLAHCERMEARMNTNPCSVPVRRIPCCVSLPLLIPRTRPCVHHQIP